MPGILALEYCGDDTLLSSAKHQTDMVFRTMQNLFELDYKSRQVPFEEISAHAEKMYMKLILPEDLRLGLLLAPTIGVFVGGYEWDEERGVLKWVGTNERIVDYQSIGEEWRKKVDEIRARNKPTVISPAPSRTIETKAAPQEQSFDFIRDVTLRSIFERDYRELQAVKSVASTKSRLILAGGLIETLLLDLLLPHDEKLKQTKARKRLKRPIEEWFLGDLIDGAVEIGLLHPSHGTVSHSLREFRNLVHPGRERRSTMRVAEQEATIAVAFLEILIRECSEGRTATTDLQRPTISPSVHSENRPIHTQLPVSPRTRSGTADRCIPLPM